MVSLAAASKVTGLRQTFFNGKMAWMSSVHVDKQEPHQGKDLTLPAQELGLGMSAEQS